MLLILCREASHGNFSVWWDPVHLHSLHSCAFTLIHIWPSVTSTATKNPFMWSQWSVWKGNNFSDRAPKENNSRPINSLKGCHKSKELISPRSRASCALIFEQSKKGVQMNQVIKDKDTWVNISIPKALLDTLLKSALQHDYEAQASLPKDFCDLNGICLVK